MATGTETAPVDSGGSNRGVAVRPVPLRVTLYVLIALSALAALVAEPQLTAAVARGSLSPLWLYLPLAFFCTSLVVYAVDRALLVRRGRYPVGKALLQVAFGTIFALLLLPSTIHHYHAATAQRPEASVRLLRHRDSGMRRTAVRALGFQGETAERRKMLAPLLHDPSADVRSAVQAVFQVWDARPESGNHPGSPASSGASEGKMEKTR